MEDGYIYKLTLKKDLVEFKKNEVYIGKHNGAKKEYFGSGKIVKFIIKKYGKEVFKRELIVKDINEDELLSYLEVYYIKYYKCNRSKTKLGLNLTDGGEGIIGLKRTEEQCKNMSEALKKTYLFNGRRPVKEKPLYQYSLETGLLIKQFKNCIEAAKETGVTNGSIAYCARGKCVSIKGFAYSYKLVDKHIVNERHKRPVLQYNLEMEFIKEWKSATDACRVLGYSNSSITNCCKGISKSSYGFKWIYKENKIN